MSIKLIKPKKVEQNSASLLQPLDNLLLQEKMQVLLMANNFRTSKFVPLTKEIPHVSDFLIFPHHLDCRPAAPRAQLPGCLPAIQSASTRTCEIRTQEQIQLAPVEAGKLHFNNSCLCVCLRACVFACVRMAGVAYWFTQILQPICGIPAVEYTLHWLQMNGYREVNIVVCNDPETEQQLMEYFKPKRKLTINIIHSINGKRYWLRSLSLSLTPASAIRRTALH